MWQSKFPKCSSAYLKTPKITLFWVFWPETQIFFAINLIFFYFCFSFWFQSDGYFDYLSNIWVKQSDSEVFECRPETSKKPPSFDVLRPKTNFFCIKLPLFVSTPCASIRAVVFWVWVSLVWHRKIPKSSSAYLKTPNKTILLSFLAQKAFFLHKLPFLFLGYRVHSSGQLSCYFEPNLGDTVKLRSLF